MQFTTVISHFLYKINKQICQGFSTYAYNAEADEGDELEEDPGLVVLHEEQHRVLVAEWVDGTQDERRDQRAEERTPQSLQREVVRHLRTNILYQDDEFCMM